MHKRYYVYCMTNNSNEVIYIGVTNDINRRVMEHADGRNKQCFTYRYRCFKLVYFEEFGDISQAIAREKYLKGKNRAYKRELISGVNPLWRDLMIERL